MDPWNWHHAPYSITIHRIEQSWLTSYLQYFPPMSVCPRPLLFVNKNTPRKRRKKNITVEWLNVTWPLSVKVTRWRIIILVEGEFYSYMWLDWLVPFGTRGVWNTQWTVPGWSVGGRALLSLLGSRLLYLYCKYAHVKAQIMFDLSHYLFRARNT